MVSMISVRLYAPLLGSQGCACIWLARRGSVVLNWPPAMDRPLLCISVTRAPTAVVAASAAPTTSTNRQSTMPTRAAMEVMEHVTGENVYVR